MLPVGEGDPEERLAECGLAGPRQAAVSGAQYDAALAHHPRASRGEGADGEQVGAGAARPRPPGGATVGRPEDRPSRADDPGAARTGRRDAEEVCGRRRPLRGPGQAGVPGVADHAVCADRPAGTGAGEGEAGELVSLGTRVAPAPGDGRRPRLPGDASGPGDGAGRRRWLARRREVRVGGEPPRRAPVTGDEKHAAAILARTERPAATEHGVRAPLRPGLLQLGPALVAAREEQPVLLVEGQLVEEDAVARVRAGDDDRGLAPRPVRGRAGLVHERRVSLPAEVGVDAAAPLPRDEVQDVTAVTDEGGVGLSARLPARVGPRDPPGAEHGHRLAPALVGAEGREGSRVQRRRAVPAADDVQVALAVQTDARLVVRVALGGRLREKQRCARRAGRVVIRGDVVGRARLAPGSRLGPDEPRLVTPRDGERRASGVTAQSEAPVGDVDQWRDDELVAFQSRLRHPERVDLTARHIGRARPAPDGEEWRAVDLVVSHPVLDREGPLGQGIDLPGAAAVQGDEQDVARGAVAQLDDQRVVGAVLTVEDDAVVAQAPGAHGPLEPRVRQADRGDEVQPRPRTVDQCVDVGRALR